MILTERHIISKHHKYYRECDELCLLSKNIYNYANYIIRQHFMESDGDLFLNEENKYLNYYFLNKHFIKTKNDDYYKLPAKVSNGTLRLLDKNWISFFKAIKKYAKNPDKFLGRPKTPSYKHSTQGRCVTIYEKGAISLKKLKKGILKLSKTNIELKLQSVNSQNIQSARIVPNKNDHYVIEIMYTVDEKILDTQENNTILGIDIGVNNLGALVTTEGDSLLINGKPLKSINQYYNKSMAKLRRSRNKEETLYTKKMKKLTMKRDNKINDYLHKASNHIVKYCLTKKIGAIVIGKNDLWKQKVKMGKKNNQKFVDIPFAKFINVITYKAKLEGIIVIETEESYTSKCSFVDDESLNYHKKYLGKRVNRGTFKSKDGILINSDIQGALNIIRKVVPLFNFDYLKSISELWNRGCAVHPQLTHF